MNLADHVRDIPDFPKKGILFKDITTLIGHAEAFKESINQLEQRFADSGATAIVAVEARGYIFGAPLADRLGIRFVPVRKPGKLPAESLSESYDLEYGSNILEIHKDALTSDDRVIIIDDLIATGGSALATIKLVKRLGAEVIALGAVIELAFLNGRDALDGVRVESLLSFD